MKTIDFKYLYKYFSDIIQAKASELYEKGEIEEDLKFIFFNNTGEYFKTMDEIEYSEDSIDRRVLVNILNNGGIQDSTVSIDTYLQLMSFEILALDEQRYDIMELFTQIVADNKSKVDILNFDEPIYDAQGELITNEPKTSTIQVTMNEFPTFENKIDVHGIEKFVTRMKSNIIVFPNAYLSNSYKFNLDGNDVQYTNIILSRNTETTADLQKRDTLKFYPNTTGFQIQVSGLFVDNPSLETLLEDCAMNTKFNQTYLISLIKPNGSTLVSDKFYCKDSRFDLKWGSIISWQAVFYLAEEKM